MKPYLIAFGICAVISTGIWLAGVVWYLAILPLLVPAIAAAAPLVMLYLSEKRGE